jgi:branched-subunit amino acid aminotransferase/4-amino-4-deoxychorismate lyase
MSTVFLNGSFVEPADARLSAFDAGFQHGVGLFETMTAVAGPRGTRPRIPGLWEHLERLRVSAHELGLVSTLHTNALAEAVERTAAREAEARPDTARFRVRLTISGGDLNLLHRPIAGDHHPTLLIHAQPAAAYPHEMFERGVRVRVADLRVNPFDPSQGHKTLNYWSRLRELQAAAGVGAGEALVFQITNHLAGGCVSNAFLVKGGELITPIARGEEVDVAAGPTASNPDRPPPEKAPSGVLPSPVLPGITRRWVLDWSTGADIPVRRRMITIEEVLDADEVFLTNASWGVLPVVAVEQARIGTGEPGPTTRRLVRSFTELLAPKGEDP